ncbi:MAG: 50S ribosomal protein L11 methyltransferase [Lewinellaceae bacterium]|nr:50S ribosomal protein L11 methyltransferase [Lewinellaceae bacterium]
MNYWQYTLRTEPETAEILLAYLESAPFDTFEETTEGLHAYLPDQEGAQQTVEDLLAGLQQDFPFAWEKTFIPAQNWNEVWESNFQPVVVRDFCAVRADFHDPIEGVQFELHIQPRMAFGTGHHETTWMCMSAMEALPIQDASLLDYGCGTGILAILASKLGARHIEAVDIEEESWRNTIDNCAANAVDNVVARCGTIEAVQGTAFDGILANINRNVILDSLPRLAQLTRPGGWLLASGFMPADEDVVTQTAAANGFAVQSVEQRGYWLCIHFVRR